MLRALFEALVFSSAEGLWHGFMHAYQRDNASPQQDDAYGWRNRCGDPVYKKNLQRLIERNRQFEEATK